jgi:hypothetical protein
MKLDTNCLAMKSKSLQALVALQMNRATFSTLIIDIQEELGFTAQFLWLNFQRFVLSCLAGSWNGKWNISLVMTLMGCQVLPLKDTATTDHGLSPDKSIVIIP